MEPIHPNPNRASNKGLTKHCDRHPNRRAIGVCVITKRAICGECSTQHNGVNYSKEGLKILLDREKGQAVRIRGWERVAVVLCLLLAPGVIYLIYEGFLQMGNVIIDLFQWADDAGVST